MTRSWWTTMVTLSCKPAPLQMIHTKCPLVDAFGDTWTTELRQVPDSTDEALLKLTYGIYDRGNVGTIQSHRGAKVDDLENTLKELGITAVGGCAMAFYFARKNGKWLKDDENLPSVLRKPADGVELKLMDRELRLKDYFASDFQCHLHEIHILVDLSADCQQTLPLGSTTKQVQYKDMSVEASCRKFLDKLSKTLYDKMGWVYSGKQPTFGDVMKAKLGYKKLRCLLSLDEWKFLQELNEVTNARIHNATIPKTSKQRGFVILPDRLDNEDSEKHLKSILEKAEMPRMDIKHEGALSGSSGSSRSSSSDEDPPPAI